jgi:outer membrane protein assembly factor BamB
MSCKSLLGGLALLLAASQLLIAAAPAPTLVPQGDWPQWRGPRRDGVSTDTGLLKAWPKEGPPLLWAAKGAGRGYASLAITGGRIYTLGDNLSTASDPDEYVSCFDEADGKQLWKAKLGPAWNSGSTSWQSSRSTPTVDGELLYILTPHGNLHCLETATGKERWRKSMQKDFGGKKGDGWGYSESALVDGERLLCTPGGSKATMVALDKKTGQTVWTAVAPNDPGAGHASIVPAEVGGTRVYVQTTAGGALGVRASDGKVLWTYPIGRTTAVIPTPIIKGDLVFFSAGYSRGGALLRQAATSDGGVKIEEVYPLNTQLNNKHGGVVMVGDYIYGDTNDGGRPWCAEFMTGKVRWNSRGAGSGSAALAAAEGRLYVRYANGVMVLAEASPEAYKEISTFKIPHASGRPSWSHPVITGGKLFLREGDHILCYDLRAK